MSQSSVSEAVKALERALGAPLFDRTSRRVALTPLGETLRQGAAPAVIMLKAALDDCRRQASGKQRRLSIGFLGGDSTSCTGRWWPNSRPRIRASNWTSPN